MSNDCMSNVEFELNTVRSLGSAYCVLGRGYVVLYYFYTFTLVVGKVSASKRRKLHQCRTTHIHRVPCSREWCATWYLVCGYLQSVFRHASCQVKAVGGKFDRLIDIDAVRARQVIASNSSGKAQLD
jgi:hypothetical protein